MGWQNNVFNQLIVEGTDSGIFIYSGKPALGNLIGSWASVAGVDPYGNTYPQGLQVENGQIIIIPAGFFMYSGTPANGNLFFSIAANPGTDKFGNPYPGGLSVGIQPNPLAQMFTAGSGSNAEGDFGIFISSKYIESKIIGGTENPGAANEFAFTEYAGPQALKSGFTDWTVMTQFTSDSVSSSANQVFTYQDLANISHDYGVLDCTGLKILAGSVTATDPTTGTTATPAQAETWHQVFLDGGWSNVNDGIKYRLNGDGTVQVFGAVTRGTAFTTGTPINSSHPIPSQYWPSVPRNVGCSGIPNRAGLEITTAGVLTAEANGVSCTECDPGGYYPLY
jgi:hypothetical protein